MKRRAPIPPNKVHRDRKNDYRREKPKVELPNNGYARWQDCPECKHYRGDDPQYGCTTCGR
jgi:hypothetical protein